MKTFTFVMTTFVLCAGLTLTGFAAKGHVDGKPFAGNVPAPSVASHEAAIEQHQDKATELAQQIQRLEHRLDLVKNSYRDPKGFRQASWERVLGTWRQELQGIQDRIVWHEQQIALLKTGP